MRLKLETEGGFAAFPGLRAPIEIDTDELQEQEAAELVRCVEEARFFERTEGPRIRRPGPPASACTKSQSRKGCEYTRCKRTNPSETRPSGLS